MALDLHGTLIARNQADDLQVVRKWRETLSKPAREFGIPVIIISAAPTREIQAAARLLDLGDQPGVAELGHIIMPAILKTRPHDSPKVTNEIRQMLRDIERMLRVEERLPAEVFLEPKNIIVSLNLADAPQERDTLREFIETYISQRRLPLYVSISDSTIDVGIQGVNKANGLFTVISDLKFDLKGLNILAVGDSRNDMDLLRVSRMCGCPANSHPTVKDYVDARGGIVSKYLYLAGTLDVLSQLLQRISAFHEAGDVEAVQYGFTTNIVP